MSAENTSDTSRPRAAGAVTRLPDGRLAPAPQIGEILEAHAIEDPLAARQVGQATRAVKSLPSSAAGPIIAPGIDERSVVAYST